MIPDRLKGSDIQFCKVMSKSKRPYEKDWVNKGYSAEEIDTSTGNYGVLGGYGNLIVIDSDTQELQEAVEQLPKTFRVRTGSGGCHDYYFCGELKKKLVLSKDGKHYGEVQSYGSQVVGPGSMHPNGNKYEIEQDLEIQTIDLPTLIEVVKHFTSEFNKDVTWESPQTNFDSEYDINSISLESVISGTFSKQTNGEYLGKNPWHGSSTGINFCVNPVKNVAHCFRCNKGVNVAQAIALNEGIIKNCGDSLSKENFLEVLKVAEAKHGLKRPVKISAPGALGGTGAFSELQNQVFQLIALKKRDTATELIVRDILSKNYIYTTRKDERDEMWIYYKGIYVPEGRTHISEMCRKILGELHSPQLTNLVLNKVSDDTRIDQDKFFESATKNVKEIPLENGIFNLITKQLGEFNPSKIFFNKLPLSYDPSATCPNIDQHFKDVLKSEDDIEVMYELFGYLLWKDHFIEKAIMMVGGGRNGKGKSVDLMKRFVGIDNCASVPLYSLSGENFRVSELFGKMANLAGDLSNAALKDTANFKQITGRDLLGATRKFKSSINFINYSKQIFACNELPRVFDYSLGFWNRWILFEFPYVFLDAMEYDKSDLPNKRRMNPGQIEKISTPEELSGLFNKAVEKLDEIRKNKNFSYSKGTDEVKQFWVRASDSFAAFCMDHVEEKYDGIISKKALRKAYYNYCKEHNLKGTSEKSMAVVMEQNFGAITNRTATNFENREFVWEGVKFKEKSRFSFQDGVLNDGK